MNDPRERTDEELAAAAKRGDARAYDLLVRRYLRPALALARQFRHPLEEAEDIVQEAFHRMVRALPGYDSKRPFGAWFYTIVRNAGRSSLSREGRRAALAPLFGLGEETEAAPSRDPALAGDLERAIQTLAGMQQICIRLCEIEGFTSVEAARMLGIGEGTVRTHLFRARKLLRAFLEPPQRMNP